MVVGQFEIFVMAASRQSAKMSSELSFALSAVFCHSDGQVIRPAAEAARGVSQFDRRAINHSEKSPAAL